MKTFKEEIILRLSFFNIKLDKELTMNKIDRSYRELAKKYHPDLNVNEGELMKKVNDYYDWLKLHFETIYNRYVIRNEENAFLFMFKMANTVMPDEKVKRNL